MAKTPTFTTLKERNTYIVGKKKEGLTNEEISRRVKLSTRQIQNISRTFKTDRRLIRKRGSGRKKALSKGAKTSIKNQLRANPYKSCQAIASNLQTKVSPRTIQRYLRETSWTFKKAKRVPKLTQRHKTLRVEWAKNHKKFKWSNVVFSDECTFTLNQCRYGWSQKGSKINQESLCYNPIVQIWGAISSKGVVNFEIYEGTVDSQRYIDILENSLVDVAPTMFGDRWVYQQDGARPHTSRLTKAYLNENVPEVLAWPPNSPDLNPIENVWAALKQRVYSKKPKDVENMRMLIEEETDKITKKECNNLISSMRDRVEMLIESQGNVIPY